MFVSAIIYWFNAIRTSSENAFWLARDQTWKCRNNNEREFPLARWAIQWASEHSISLAMTYHRNTIDHDDDKEVTHLMWDCVSTFLIPNWTLKIGYQSALWINSSFRMYWVYEHDLLCKQWKSKNEFHFWNSNTEG